MPEDNCKGIHDIQLFRKRSSIKLRACVSKDSGARYLEEICDQSEKTESTGILDGLNLGSAQRNMLGNTLGENYIIFVGQYKQPRDKNKTYIPFDILVRPDADKLVKLMGECQHGST